MTAWPLRDLVPHSGSMVLIDEVLDCASDRLSASTVVRAGGPFNNPDGSLPAWVGLELMAQSIAAWAGWHAQNEQRPVQLGFLLGTRLYECNVGDFPLGAALRIDVERTLQDDSGIGVFECTLQGKGIQARARVNVFQPRDPSTYLQTT